MLKIRLTRMGKKHQPTYRIVVTPKEHPVSGTYVDLIGTYDPIRAQVNIDTEKAIAWLNKGAQPSERIARLLDKAGVKHKSITVKHYTPKAKEEVATEAAPAAEETVTEEETSAETTEEAAVETPEPTDAPAEEKSEETPAE